MEVSTVTQGTVLLVQNPARMAIFLGDKDGVPGSYKRKKSSLAF